jgi:hypothetical protein
MMAFDLRGQHFMSPRQARFRTWLAVFAIALTIGPRLQAQGSYTTSFPLTEDPISEGARWINGRTAGIDWSDVRTTPGKAFGSTINPVAYSDPTALLNGNWGPNQTVQAWVYSVNQRNDAYQEIELRLRSSISAHVNSGYEINFRCTHDGSQYSEIVRWNGGSGSFTYLSQKGANDGLPGIYNGDIVKATITGGTITVYVNNVQINTATDSTFASGKPGIGFYLQGPGQLSDFGFTKVIASDGGTTPPPAPPTNVRIIR